MHDPHTADVPAEGAAQEPTGGTDPIRPGYISAEEYLGSSRAVSAEESRAMQDRLRHEQALAEGEPLAEALTEDRSTVAAARAGLAPSALDAVREALFGEGPSASDAAQFARALGVSERTLSRRKASTLPSALSDRLLLLAETYDLAVQALGTADRARDWLTRPHALFDGESPLDRLDTLAGTREVQSVLYQIEYGMPA